MNKIAWVSVFAAAALSGCGPDTESQTTNFGRDVSQVPNKQVMRYQPNSDLAPAAPPGSETPGHPALSPSSGSPAGPMPGSTRADQTVVGKYKSVDGSALEVVGVCKTSEDGVSCWNTQGAEDKNLVSWVLSDISKQSSTNPYAGAFTFRLGRKNRILIVKSTQPGQGIGSTFTVLGVGRPPNLGGFGMQMLPTREPRQIVHYEMRACSEDKSATTTTLHAMEFQSAAPATPIDFRAGQSGNVAGETYTIASISKWGVSKSGPLSGLPSWIFRLNRTTNGMQPSSVFIDFLDSAGHVLQYVDPQGKPITDDEYSRMIQRNSSASDSEPANVSTYRRARTQISVQAGAVIVLTSFDPAQIPKISIRATFSRTVDIAGIPLDPKKS